MSSVGFGVYILGFFAVLIVGGFGQTNWEEADPLFNYVKSYANVKPLQVISALAKIEYVDPDASNALPVSRDGGKGSVVEDPPSPVFETSRDPQVNKTGFEKLIQHPGIFSLNESNRLSLNLTGRQTKERRMPWQSSTESSMVKIYFTYRSKPASSIVDFDSSCSGAMIDDTTVLTAAHCVYSVVRDRYHRNFFVIPAMSEDVSPDSDIHADRPYGVAHVVDVKTFGYISEGGNLSYDYGVLRLDRPIPNGKLKPSSKLPRSGARISFMGYPGVNFDGKTLIKSTGRIKTVVNPWVREADALNCNGFSGSNVYTLQCVKGWCAQRIVGVVSYTRCASGPPCCARLTGIVMLDAERREELNSVIRNWAPAEERPYVIWFFDSNFVTDLERAWIPDTFWDGEKIEWRLSVINRGPVRARNVVISIYLVTDEFDVQRNSLPVNSMTFLGSYAVSDNLQPDEYMIISDEVRMVRNTEEGDKFQLVAVILADDEYRKDLSSHFIYLGTTTSRGIRENPTATGTEQPHETFVTSEPSVEPSPSASAEPSASASAEPSASASAEPSASATIAPSATATEAEQTVPETSATESAIEQTPTARPTAEELIATFPGPDGEYLRDAGFEKRSRKWARNEHASYSEKGVLKGNYVLLLGYGGATATQTVVLKARHEYRFTCQARGSTQLKMTVMSAGGVVKQIKRVSNVDVSIWTRWSLDFIADRLAYYDLVLSSLPNHEIRVDNCSLTLLSEGLQPTKPFPGGELLRDAGFKTVGSAWELKNDAKVMERSFPKAVLVVLSLPSRGEASQTLVLEAGSAYVFECVFQGSGPLWMSVFSRHRSVLEVSDKHSPERREFTEWTTKSINITETKMQNYQFVVRAALNNDVFVNRCSVVKMD
uniref:Peptidase S1 domain-containing protein n=1 Tax=Rhodosorus marinus TaxID=101924 RepID=A0A7S3EA28_9RHOD|mmetsp:Transcript_17696/g.71432  ORF Transcript_17696/g.71432 Transcript_17696/m.71432 type:complete len:886 (+) Transcript_17696:742-3399(+)